MSHVASRTGYSRWSYVALALLFTFGLVERGQAQTSALSSASSSISSAESSPAATQATTFIGLIQQIPALCAACKAKFCASCCGQMVQSMLTPISMATGGCVTCCPPVSKADLANPGAAGACALIVQDTLDAKKRVEAVECLASVDCRYWPEAEKQLIASLRADKNEGVRLAAALVLGSGCCCTKNTIEALTMTVEGSSKDGNPVESSQRVRAAAASSLQHCLSCYTGPLTTATPPETPVPPEAPPGTAPQIPPPAPQNELTPVPAAPRAMLSPVPSARIASVQTQTEPPANRIPQLQTSVSYEPTMPVPIVDDPEPVLVTPADTGEATIVRAQKALQKVAEPTASAAQVKSGDRSIAGIFRAARQRRAQRSSSEQVTAANNAQIPVARPIEPVPAGKSGLMRFFR